MNVAHSSYGPAYLTAVKYVPAHLSAVKYVPAMCVLYSAGGVHSMLLRRHSKDWMRSGVSAEPMSKLTTSNLG